MFSKLFLKKDTNCLENFFYMFEILSNMEDLRFKMYYRKSQKYSATQQFDLSVT